VFAVLVPPVITAALLTAYGASWDTLFAYWGAFVGGPPGSIAAKCVFAFAFPLLVAGAYPAMLPVATTSPPEPQPASPPANPAQPATVAA
jgi:hypothetical protein